MKGSAIFVLYFTFYNQICFPFDIKKTLLNPFQINQIDTLGDLNKCRVTHSGEEYAGNIAKTISGILCQNWETPDPVHKAAEQIVNADFPDGSKKKAKNYCRNPQRWSGRPWCYTLSSNIMKEDCAIPLCMKKGCRLTGLGVEYAGITHTSGSRNCLSWSGIRVDENTQHIAYDSLFPDGTRKNAENKCRNPDSDVGGPWCFVESITKLKSNSIYEKGYCGVPLCDPKPCMMATAAIQSGYQEYHTVFSLLPTNTTNIEFSVRLWRPEEWKNGELKIALSAFPLPATGSQMRTWKTGVEIIISTYKSGITPGYEEKSDWNIETGLLSGTRWQNLELSWTGSFVSLKVKGKAMAVFNKDFTNNEEDFSREPLKYYSIKGTYALWNFPYCLSDYKYEEHITTHGDFERRWPFPKSNVGFKLIFFVRGIHSAIIEMKVAAMLQYPSLQLTLVNRKSQNFTTLTLKDSVDSERETLGSVEIENLLSYWEWKEYTLYLDGPRMELYSIQNARENKLLSVIHPKIESVKWFSIGSRQSTIHWTINIGPPPNKRKINAEPPECVMNAGEAEFKGFQSVTATGLTCVPWADTTGMTPQDLNDDNFVDGSKENAKNYCRNPTNSAEGPFCYAVDLTDTSYTVTKQFCFPRHCRSQECKMSGTGNDYNGHLSSTSSSRTCQRWMDNTPHSIPKNLLVKEMFPELSLTNIDNFCRNPTHDPAGLWCYTEDPTVDIDLCNVPDCDAADACRIVVRGNSHLQKVFILPVWKTNGVVFKVKSWDPKTTEGIRFVILPRDSSTSYRLDLGAGDNDKIALYHIDHEGKERILKQKTVSRVIPSGHWVEFVLLLGIGEFQINFENVPTPFFHWKYTFSEGIEPVHPAFISYSTLDSGSSVGLSFLCEECQTHITQPGLVDNFYPLNWWNPKVEQSDGTHLKFNFWGIGTAVILLARLISPVSSRVLIEVSDYGRVVIKNIDHDLAEYEGTIKMFNNNSWTNFSLILTEEKLIIAIGKEQIITYNSSVPLVFYFFSLSVSEGILFWSVNCEPPNINANPINGGWSNWGPWECSVTCGGGHGKRRRLCNRPKPNIYGQACNGSNTMEGVCNDFRCGDVPPDLFRAIENRITKQAHNVRKHVNESLSILCDDYVLAELKDKAPKTKVEWTKDGVPLFPQQEVRNVTIDNYSVDKTHLTLNDSGVYICALEDRKKTRAVIKIVAVTIVTNSPTKIEREGRSIVLNCYAETITFLFPELTQFWLLNSKMFQDYGGSSQSLIDIDLLEHVNKAHEGEWECVVVQVEHNLTWVTTWFNLNVIPSSYLAIMLDTVFVGHHFRPFGDNYALNTFTGLVLIASVATILVLIVLPFILSRKKSLVVGGNLSYKSFSGKNYTTLTNEKQRINSAND